MLRLEGALLRRGFVAVLVFACCLLPWPGLGPTFTRALSGVASWLVGGLRLSASLAVEFRCAADMPQEPRIANASWQMLLMIRDPVSGWQDWLYAVDLRKLAFIPLALFVALTLAAPISRTRAWLASVLIGLLFIAALVSVSVAMPVVNILGRAHLISSSREILWITRALGWMLASAGSTYAILLWGVSKWMAIPRAAGRTMRAN